MRRIRLTTALLVFLSLTAKGDLPTCHPAETILTEDLAQLTPENARAGRPGRFVFVFDSLTDEVGGCVLVEAAGREGCLRTVLFASGETDEGLDRAAPVVVEGYLIVLLHKPSGQFPAVVEVQVRDAKRVRSF